jgi:hypothetical protein
VPPADPWSLDHAVYQPGQRAGHYESFYVRANHPDRPLAFWIRYTIFAPQGRPDAAVGELWAVAFDGETGRHTVAKLDVPIADCEFRRDAFAVRVGTAELGPGRLVGAAGALGWDLSFTGSEAPLRLLPAKLYDKALPKAKSLVPLPLARFTGSYTVDGRTVDVTDWVGSQNHNWGREHTDRYAFGQVAGFDGEPDSFLEVATVKTRIAGPLSTPWLTTLVLRHRGREHSLVSLRRAITARGSYRYFTWHFASANRDVEIGGRITAEPEAFVGLRYPNPPGGSKFCLNTKIGEAELTVRDRRSGTAEILRTRNRALFEILTADTDHGIAIRA